MWSIRTRVNLLLANGHPDAHDYSLAVLADEAALVIERLNGRSATDALAFQAAAASIMSKEGGEAFKSIIATLNGE